MSIGIVLAGLLAAAGPVAEASNPQAVTAYPAAFFAPSQPNTALDMLTRLPGFTLNGGSAVRGFGDAAGNVLIDGERQTAKDDSLDEVIKRIPASAVLRIELIRSGAPGIDMQGKTLLANIVRRKDRGVKLAVSVSGTRWYDGRLGRGLRVEGETRLGATRIEGALALDRGIDDAAGDGTRIVIDPNSQTIKRYGEHNAGDTRTYKLTAAVEAPLWGGSTRLNGSLSSAPYRLLQDDDPLASGAADSLDVFNQNHKTGEIGLRYNHALGAKASVETVVLQQFGHYKQTDDFTAGAGVAHLRLVKKTSESIARVTIKYDPTITLSLQTGVEGDYNWLRAATAYAIDGVAVGLPAANVRVSETRGEGFVTATWRPTAKLAVETGLRIEASRIVAAGDVVSNRNFVYFKPRAVLTWSPDAAEP